MIKKIDHLNIVVKDLLAAEEFFALLGFITKRQGKLEGQWIETLTTLNNVSAEFVGMVLPDDSVVLEILSFQNPAGSRDDHISELNQIGFRHLALQVEDIDDVVAKLKPTGVVFLSEIQDYEPLSKKLCYLIGPEGIVLELAEYTSAPPHK